MMDPEAVRNRFIDAGYQVVEHLFNDDLQEQDCFVRATLCNNPRHYTLGAGCSCRDEQGRSLIPDLGWGRFSRMTAWRLAAEHLDREEG